MMDKTWLVFEPFSKIPTLDDAKMAITQKIHGSNAQIYIYENSHDGQLHVACGNRSKYITPENDNHGFAKFVYANKDEFAAKLGRGRHFGEWAGKRINTGEGLEDKRFFLFNWRKWAGKELPDKVSTVPLLYHGIVDSSAIENTFKSLREHGSFICPGYMKPEGIVIDIGGHLFKKVFNAEEVQWSTSKQPKVRNQGPQIDVGYLLQPLRMEKLLSRDESYIVQYPTSIGRIVTDYCKDLEDENQFRATNDEDKAKEIKALKKCLFYFIKTMVFGYVQANTVTFTASFPEGSKGYFCSNGE
jgi:RNA ligase